MGQIPGQMEGTMRPISNLLVMLFLLWCAAAIAADLAMVPEACMLMTNEDVQKIAGEELGKPEPDKTTEEDGVKLSGCTYSSTDGDKAISLTLRASKSGDNDPPGMIKAM